MAGERLTCFIRQGRQLFACYARPGVSSSCVPVTPDQAAELQRRAAKLAQEHRKRPGLVIGEPIPTFDLPADTGGITEEDDR